MTNPRNPINQIGEAATLLAAILLILIVAAQMAKAQQPQQIDVLHYTETSGYNHNTAGNSWAMMQAIANQITQGGAYTMTVTDAPGSGAFADLSQYEIIVFSNTSGCNILTAAERAEFEAWLDAGGNTVAWHAASDTYRHSTANGNCEGVWDYFPEQVTGASVQNNPNHTANNYTAPLAWWTAQFKGTILNPWTWTDEFYYWQNGYLNPAFHTVLTTPQTGNQSYDAPRMAAQYFVDSTTCSRRFYTSLGHHNSAHNITTDFGQMIYNAVLWAAAGGPGTCSTLAIKDSDFVGTREIDSERLKVGPEHIHTEEEAIGQPWTAMDATGRIVATGTVDESGIRRIHQPGLVIYRTYGATVKVWNR